jgi:hypothetical protein
MIQLFNDNIIDMIIQYKFNVNDILDIDIICEDFKDMCTCDGYITDISIINANNFKNGIYKNTFNIYDYYRYTFDKSNHLLCTFTYYVIKVSITTDKSQRVNKDLFQYEEHIYYVNNLKQLSNFLKLYFIDENGKGFSYNVHEEIQHFIDDINDDYMISNEQIIEKSHRNDLYAHYYELLYIENEFNKISNVLVVINKVVKKCKLSL